MVSTLLLHVFPDAADGAWSRPIVGLLEQRAFFLRPHSAKFTLCVLMS